MNENAPTVTILDARHQLTLHGVTRAEDSFTVAYSISPPLPEGPDDEIPVLLTLEARDELGNEYTDWGGAFGLSPDGSHTEGTISGQPVLPSGAGTLHVRLTFLRDGDEFPYDVTLPVHRTD
ncbi:hypothetical protein ACIBCO_41640 [Streptomyces violascens]|uniref:hypothetical protein n=1 Tax=Streptomyces violascens TaxID=67381 RepID=UPI00379F6220